MRDKIWGWLDIVFPMVCIVSLAAGGVGVGVLLAAELDTAEPAVTRTRTRATVVVAPADWPAVRAVWTEVNVWPTEDAPHPKLVETLRAAAAWRGIATHLIVVNHHTRVNTRKKRALFWGYAQAECRKLGMVLVPSLKVHDEIHPWTSEQLRAEVATGMWATRLVDYAEGLHREFGVPSVATDWEGFNKLSIKTGIDGDHFGLIRPAFQRAADTEWRFWHWFPGLTDARYEYREREDHDATWRAARVRWNFARAAFNSPRDRLLAGNGYYSATRWGTATETRFDPAIERERSFRSLGVHNVIEGFTCAAQRTLHDGNLIFRYLMPREVVEMPAWQTSDEVFLYVASTQLEKTGRRWQRLARTLAN